MNRPYVIINSAMSADGKISSRERKQIRISGQADMARVDELRATSDAIMVGVGTVLADDPGLRIKSADSRAERLRNGQFENPLRLVADSMARTPPTAKVLGPGCMLAVSRLAPEERLERLMPICEVVTCGEGQVDLAKLMAVVHGKGVRRLMVEGGAKLNWSMIKLELVDELLVYVGNLLIGGKDAPTLVDGEGFCREFPQLKLCSVDVLDEGVLLKWRLVSQS